MSSQPLYGVWRKYTDMVEIIITKKPSVNSYDFAQFLHMERMLNKGDYESLSRYSYFDDVVKKYNDTLDTHKLRDGLKGMTENLLGHKSTSNIKHGSDEYDAEDDMFVEVDRNSFLDDNVQTYNIEGGSMMAEPFLLQEKEHEINEEQSSDNEQVSANDDNGQITGSYDEGQQTSNVLLMVPDNEDNQNNEESFVWFVQGGKEDNDYSFKYRDRIMFFETLQEVGPEDLKEIFGVEDEDGLDKIINMSDEEFAEYVNGVYGTSVSPVPYKKIEANSDLRDKIKYILDREGHLLK